MQQIWFTEVETVTAFQKWCKRKFGSKILIFENLGWFRVALKKIVRSLLMETKKLVKIKGRKDLETLLKCQ